MRIERVHTSISDIGEATRFFRDGLGLRVEEARSGVEVQIGSSILELFSGPTPAPGRAHHLAFTVPSDRFDEAKGWLSTRTSLISKDGREEFHGPPGWSSRSIYFHGPDGAVLELIARRRLPDTSRRPGFTPTDLLGISEVMIAVPDPSAAADLLRGASNLERFAPVTETFVPVGDDHGLLIFVQPDRVCFPTADTRPLLTPLTVKVDTRLHQPVGVAQDASVQRA